MAILFVRVGRNNLGFLGFFDFFFGFFFGPFFDLLNDFVVAFGMVTAKKLFKDIYMKKKFWNYKDTIFYVLSTSVDTFPFLLKHIDLKSFFGTYSLIQVGLIGCNERADRGN